MEGRGPLALTHFDRKRDALLLDAELRRRRRLGMLSSFDAGPETLGTYVTVVWAPSYCALLAPKTRRLYTMLFDAHISPTLGSTPLRELTPEIVGRWQSDRLAAGAGREATRKALTLLSGIMQRAVESGHVQANLARLVRRRPPRTVPKSDPSLQRRSRQCALHPTPAMLRSSRCSLMGVFVR